MDLESDLPDLKITVYLTTYATYQAWSSLISTWSQTLTSDLPDLKITVYLTTYATYLAWSS